jgi:hypothetical protein
MGGSSSSATTKRTLGAGLALVVLLALAAWIAGRQIRSPAQVAAETAAPDPGAITVPVERRVLASEVIARGTVRYGSPQPVVLATSEVKQASGEGEIVTEPPRRGLQVAEGTVAMSVSGRPVFVLRGAQPSHRDIGPGSRGPDVAQLERGLARLGFSPGRLDDRYDGDTAAAVAAWYEGEGWAPFGATDLQLEQLRSANAAAASARDLHVQALLAIRSAAHGFTPQELAQARIDVETARDAVDTAALDLTTARLRLRNARAAARRTTGITLALRGARRDNQLAAADLALKRAVLNRAIDAQAEAQRTLAEAPPDTSPAERSGLEAALRQATDDVAVARLDVNAAVASSAATRAAGADAVAAARGDRRRAVTARRTAAARVVRTDQALTTARRQAVLSARRLGVMRAPGDTSLQGLLADSAAREANETEAEAARLAARIGVQVPGNEVLFFRTLPLRIDSVRVRRGDSLSGSAMTVSNSRLAIDSSLSLEDAQLVRPGARVTIEEPDLGVRATGVVSHVADRPGTHKVDPARVYLEVAPGAAPAQLVGASVKLTVAVKSTGGPVLTVPVTALSVGADGSSRVQRQDGGDRTEFVSVEPGLAAHGLVEVRPTGDSLKPDDLVVVGRRQVR